MLFLVISTPAPTRPSDVREQRKLFWPWVEALHESGLAQSYYPRTGRGAVVIFDVDSNETLHRLLNEWSDLIPAEFGIYPLLEPEATIAFLNEDREEE